MVFVVALLTAGCSVVRDRKLLPADITKLNPVQPNAEEAGGIILNSNILSQEGKYTIYSEVDNSIYKYTFPAKV